jgi:putative transposase
VFLVLAHDRRRVIHFNVTAHPTAEWTGQQLREAFPFDQFPPYLLRDRDAIFGQDFRDQVRDMGIEEVLSAPHSPGSGRTSSASLVRFGANASTM